MVKNLGGDRLGSGAKMNVEMRNYERSTHDLSYVWRSSMAAGTLVPFMSLVGLPGDTFDINLGAEVMTHPTVGPLFGSYKVQLDVFLCPIRLYNSALHNNKLGAGMKMENIKIPKIMMTAKELPADMTNVDLDNSQINPSCLLSYLGLRGIGAIPNQGGEPLLETRLFNAIPILAYWEIYKNYYANKQEEIGMVLHTPSQASIPIDHATTFTTGTETTLPQQGSGTGTNTLILGSQIRLYKDTATPDPTQIIIHTVDLGDQSAQDLSTGVWTDAGTYIWSPYRQTYWGNTTAQYWYYTNDTTVNTGAPSVQEFSLDNIDTMREYILASPPYAQFLLNDGDHPSITPYSWLYERPNDIPNTLSNQEGLGLKTYQSDLFNNWLQTEWIDGVDGITAITAIDTSGGSFTLDTLNLSQKVYDLLNRIAVSGGSYDDWIDAAYAHAGYRKSESPMYMGGLIKELVFQEVVSTAQNENQPLGTLAGQGRMAQKHKGGQVTIKVDEPSYIMGIISLTPRIDYSQGNTWDMYAIDTMNDLHKPALDEIGFQELIQEQMAWWSTEWSVLEGKWVQKSAGKQPAWLNYMTNVNRTYGNFAIENNEMFMTLNRRYQPDSTYSNVDDMTTYIDPSKFNFIFAETSLDAMNFWTQIGVNITARRKMSAKLMPNL